MKIGIAFNKPQSFFGKLVVWRTYDTYSHSVVVMNGWCYSSEFFGVKLKEFKAEIYPEVYWFDVDSKEWDDSRAWLESRIGKSYDILTILGWFLNIPTIQHKKFYYCHELCREVLVRLGRLQKSDDLIPAHRLIDELKGLTK
jgi:hypothetical protein